jgi:signal transduction histidine kinase
MAMRREADHLAVRNLENLSLLNSLLENAPIGFAFFDSKLCFVRANRVLALQSGHSVESHTGRPLREIAPWMSPRLEPIVSRVFATGESEHGIELHGSPVGEADIGSTWLAGAFPVRDDAGGVARVGVVLVEITERKRLEEQKANLLMSERAARAEAEQASVLKDEFLATLSHELRTPLGAIAGWTSILRRKQSHDPDVVQGLETIDRNTKVQVQLIEDLLDVSRIVSGKLRLDLKPVDLQLVIDAAQSVIAPTADAKGVRLVRTIDGQGPSWMEPSSFRCDFCILTPRSWSPTAA